MKLKFRVKKVSTFYIKPVNLTFSKLNLLKI